jgi:hypothetical protein
MWRSGSYEHICLRGHRFEAHWGHIYVFFNLILARRGMHVGMRMSFAGRGNEKDSAGMAEHEMAAGNGNELCGEERMRKTVRGWGNGNGRTRNDSLPLTALISSRDFVVVKIAMYDENEAGFYLCLKTHLCYVN